MLESRLHPCRHERVFSPIGERGGFVSIGRLAGCYSDCLTVVRAGPSSSRFLRLLPDFMVLDGLPATWGFRCPVPFSICARNLPHGLQRPASGRLSGLSSVPRKWQVSPESHLLGDVCGGGVPNVCGSVGGSRQVRQPGNPGLRLRTWVLALSLPLGAAASP